MFKLKIAVFESGKLGQTNNPGGHKKDKTDVINDPLGQTHSLASSEHCFLLFCFARFEKWTDERTTCAKTMITTGRDCGSAEWIKKKVWD